MKKQFTKVLIMVSKFTLFGILVQMLCLQLVLAIELNAQQVKSIKETTLTIELQGATIQEVFRKVEDATNFNFNYHKSDLDGNLRINYKSRKNTVADLLLHVSRETGLKFKQVNNIINVNKASRINNEDEIELEIIIQTRSISGKVTSFEDSEGLPGVNVVEKGTTNGTVTDVQGNYSLTVSEGAVLVFSSVGYTSEEVEVGNRTVIDLVMTQDIQQLQELVVIGYGTTQKRDLTGAIGSVKAEEIENIPVPGIDRAIQGRVAGVQVLANSGSPGSSTSIRIRGMGSINSNNDPLFVVDGIPISGDIEHLVSPNDVSNIEVLKDASAAAIYGSRGANGVVLITTKKGVEGKPIISIDSYYGVQNPWKKPELGTAEEFVRIHQLANQNGGTDPIPALDGVDPTTYGAGTDWWDVLTREGTIQNHNISLRGGNESVKYLSSLSFYDEKGYIKRTDYQRISFRLNTDYKINDRIKVGTNLGITNNQRDGVRENTAERAGFIPNVYQIDPATPLYKTREQIIADGADPANPFNIYHPSLFTDRLNVLGKLSRELSTNSELRMLGDIYLEVEPVKGLTFRTNFGLNLRRRDARNFNPEYFIATNDLGQENSVSQSSGTNNNWVWNNIATYHKKFDKHDLTLMAGMTAEKFTSINLSGSGRLVPTNDEDLRYLDAATIIDGANGVLDYNALTSYLGRINYTFDNKYLLTASIRYDGSSKFTEGNKWGNFPSFAAGWIISEESFMQNFGFLDFLKVRAGWGQLGNQSIPNSAIFTLLSGDEYDRYPLGTDNILYQGFRPGNVGNPDLRWEIIQQTNIGIDAEFLSNFSFTADYFQRNTVDMLLRLPIPNYVGTPSPWSNAGEVQNSGIELTLNYENNNSDFKYRIGGNFSIVRNEVISLSLGEPISSGNTRAGNATRTEPGRPISEFYGYKTDGIFQNPDEVDAYRNEEGELIQPNAGPGDFRFKDINGDGILNDDDKTYIGSPHPDFYYGFNADFSYKNFDLSLFFQGQYGNEIFLYEKFYNWVGDGTYNSIAGLEQMAWRGEGTSNSQPIISTSTDNNNFRVSDWYLSDGSFLRLKNIQLAYNLPTSLLQGLKITKAQVYVAGNNVLTFTGFEGLDPELGFYGENGNPNLNFGINQYAYPIARTFMGGVKITF